MDFSLTDEQVMLQRLLERFAEKRYGSGQRAAYRRTSQGFEPDNWRELAELGVLAACFDAEHGGLGSSADTTLVMMEAVGRALLTEPLLERLILPGRLLQHAPGHAQPWLPQLLRGEIHCAWAHIEQSIGFRLDRAATVARRTASGVLLDGDKTWVPAGAGADVFLVSAQSDQARSDELTLYLVRADAPGVTARPYRLADGSMGCTLHLHATPTVETLGCKPAAVAAAMDAARLAAGAEMVGIMASLLEATLEHVRTRKQFGTPLGSFQVVQHRLADLYVRLEQSRSQLYRAALTAGPEQAMAVAAMKSYISAAGIEMGEECVHLHGGMGMADEVAVGHGYKRLLVLATLLGDTDHELQRFVQLSEPVGARVRRRAAS